MRCVLFAVSLAALGQAAEAREVGPTETAALASGRVLVEITPAHGRGQHIWAAEDIDAPPETVWTVMTDCGEALHYVPRLKACQVVETDPAGRWDVRRHVLESIPLLPDVRATFRLDYDRPRSMRFRQIAGDMSGSEGEWLLSPLDGGRRTRVVYEAWLKVPGVVPGALARELMRHDAPSALKGLRSTSLAYAERGSR